MSKVTQNGWALILTFVIILIALPLFTITNKPAPIHNPRPAQMMFVLCNGTEKAVWCTYHLSKSLINARAGRK